MSAIKVKWVGVGAEAHPVIVEEEAFPDPNQAMKAVKKRSAKAPVREDHQGFLQWLEALRKDWQASQGQQVDPSDLPDPEIEVSEEPPVEGVPVTPDAPALQGGPAVSNAATVSAESEPAPVTYSTAQRQVFAPPPYDLPIEWLAAVLFPPPDSSDAAAKLMEEMLKGEPSDERSVLHSGQRARVRPTDADPVDLFSGVLTMRHIDLDVPTPFLPLRVTRTYRSGVPYFGPWGYNWDHNYNMYLREVSSAGVFSGIALWTGAMHEAFFRCAGNSFEPEPGIHSRLEQIEPNRYLLTQPGGTVLEFGFPPDWPGPVGARIPLLEVRDRHGNRQTLDYEAGRVKRVRERPRDSTADGGRRLEFEYGSCGLLEALRDHSGRSVRYWHHAEIEHLVRVITAPTAAYADGAVTSYEYDDRTPYPAMRHNIVRVVDPEGRAYLENEYGGPEDPWGFNRVVRQRVGDFVYEFEYEQLQFVPEDTAFVDVAAMRAVCRPPDGSLHTYTFNYRGDVLDSRYRLNRDGSFRVVREQSTYDAQGNMTDFASSDANGLALTYDSTHADPCARGNLLKVELRTAIPGLAKSRTLFEAAYDPKYQLLKESRDQNASLTRYLYDFDTTPGPAATGRLARIELPHVTLPDAQGTPQASAIDIESNLRGQVTAVSSAEHIRTTVTYHEVDASTPASKEGLLQRLTYDADGEPFAIRYEYDPAGWISRITTPPDVATDFVVNALGQLETITLPAVDGAVARIRRQFTEEATLLRVERPRGTFADGVISGDSVIDSFVPDVLGGVRKAVFGANTASPRTMILCLDHEGRPVETIDPTGMRVRRCYDERGLLIEETAAAQTASALTTRYTYDLAGRLTRVETPGGRVTTVTRRDVWGRATRVRLTNGSEQGMTWDALDRLVEVWVEGDPGDGTFRELRRQHFDYDKRSRLVRSTLFSFAHPDTKTELATTFLYDADDRLRRVTLPRGGALRYDYDGLGRLTRLEDVVGNVTSIGYNAKGDVESVTRQELEDGISRKATWLLAHDDRHRVRKTTDPAGGVCQLDFDARDLLVERREPLGTVARFQYGLLGECIEEQVDPQGLGITYRYEHDAVGRLHRFVDAKGEATTWERDALGRATGILLPDGTAWLRVYDAFGQLAEERSPSGARVSYEYDAHSGLLHRMTCTAAPGVAAVPDHEYSFDGLGRLTRARLPLDSVERRYDSLDRLRTESVLGKTLRIDFDDAAGTADLILPDGRRERTQIDVGGRANAISLVTPGVLGGNAGALLAKIDYVGADRIKTLSYANGLVSQHAYDDALRPMRIDYLAQGQLIESCRYRYDVRNRQRVVQLLGSPSLNRLHQFDARDRLIGVRSDFPMAALADALTQEQHDAGISMTQQASAAAKDVEIYVVDEADNRQSLSTANSGAPTVAYQYSPGYKLAAAGAELFSYGFDGARTADGTRAYDIDGLGRIFRVRDKSSGVSLLEIGYDALSRPSKRTVASQSSRRWFLGGSWVHEEDAAGLAKRQVTLHPANAVPLVETQAAALRVPLFNASLSAVCITDGQGKPVERTRFASFGRPRHFTFDGVEMPAGFVPDSDSVFGAMPYNAAIGLYESSQRLYDPVHGVFLSRDPLLYVDSPSPYMYAAHNPVDFVDPEGLAKRGADEPAEQEQEFDRSWRVESNSVWNWAKNQLKAAAGPDTSLFMRPLHFLASELTFSAGLAEQLVLNPILNIPADVYEAGQRLGRGLLRIERKNYLGAMADGYIAYWEFSAAVASAIPLAEVAGGALRSAGGVARGGLNYLKGWGPTFRALAKDTRGALFVGPRSASGSALAEEGLVPHWSGGGSIRAPTATRRNHPHSHDPSWQESHVLPRILGFDEGSGPTALMHRRFNQSLMKAVENAISRGFKGQIKFKGEAPRSIKGEWFAELWGPAGEEPTHFVFKYRPEAKGPTVDWAMEWWGRIDQVPTEARHSFTRMFKGLEALGK